MRALLPKLISEVVTKTRRTPSNFTPVSWKPLLPKKNSHH